VTAEPAAALPPGQAQPAVPAAIRA
jgi:hypothetical protein